MAKFFSNKDISKLLKEISAAYVVTGGNYFKIIAYDRAADNIEHATSELKDLWDDGKLDTVPGLGQSIQGYLDELFKTGHVKHFDSIKKGLPEGMFLLLDIPGMGPKSAYKLAKALKIKDVDDLEVVARAGRIKDLPGFGQKSQDDILKSIAQFKNIASVRMPLPIAFNAAQRILEYLKSLKEVKEVFPLGSLRRMVATIGDVDIGVSSKEAKVVIDHFVKFREVDRILGQGPTTAAVVLKNGIHVDLKVQPPEAFGALLQHYTGSKNHNIKLREYSLKKGESLSEYGVKSKGKLKLFETEEKFYNFLGLDWIEPELRENTGEIEAAIAHKLPKLVSLKDIKGDVHLHSNYPIEPSHDLGADSFETIIKKGKSLGYDYVGLSDHSPGFSTHSEKQIIDIVKRRSEKIDKIKYSNKNMKVLNLLEIDILTDGRLSVPENGLKLLDGAIAGIHSSHSQDKKQITKRLLNAIQSPYVQVISHPTGRLLLQRESYEADWEKVFEACVEYKTLLEINSWPSRLDLPDTLVKSAIKFGVKFVINTDAHKVDQMDNMRFGVSVARRGWAAKKDIANTLPWLEFQGYFTPVKK
jgi:DNA polymerase (family 10)